MARGPGGAGVTAVDERAEYRAGDGAGVCRHHPGSGGGPATRRPAWRWPASWRRSCTACRPPARRSAGRQSRNSRPPRRRRRLSEAMTAVPRTAETRSPPGRRPRRSRNFGCKADERPRLRLIPWEAKAKGHYDGARRQPRRSRLRRPPCSRRPTKGSGGLDRETGIRQPKVLGIGGTPRKSVASFQGPRKSWEVCARGPWRGSVRPCARQGGGSVSHQERGGQDQEEGRGDQQADYHGETIHRHDRAFLPRHDFHFLLMGAIPRSRAYNLGRLLHLRCDALDYKHENGG